jgi:hypothetical protein
MPPRSAATAAKGPQQEAPAKGTVPTSSKTSLPSSLGIIAYKTHVNHLMSRRAGGDIPIEYNFNGFDVSSSVALLQHERAFVPFSSVAPDDKVLSCPLSLSVMQEEDRKLAEEVEDMLPRLTQQASLRIDIDFEKQLAQLALNLIAAELRRRSNDASSSKALGEDSGDRPRRVALHTSRFIIDGLVRKLLSGPFFPKCFKLIPSDNTPRLQRLLQLRCALSKGRQLLKCQGSSSASNLLQLLSNQNYPEVKIVIQDPFKDEADYFESPPPHHPQCINASSEDLILHLALSFDVKGKVPEPKSEIIVRTTPSSLSVLDPSDFYLRLGEVKKELVEAWDSVRVVVMKGGAECDEKDEERAKLRALALCLRALQDLKETDKMACCIVKKDSSESRLVEIVLAECDLKRNKRGLALLNSQPVLDQMRQQQWAGGGFEVDDEEVMIRMALEKLDQANDIYAKLLEGLGGEDKLFGKGATKALKKKFEEMAVLHV